METPTKPLYPIRIALVGRLGALHNARAAIPVVAWHDLDYVDGTAISELDVQGSVPYLLADAEEVLPVLVEALGQQFLIFFFVHLQCMPGDELGPRNDAPLPYFCSRHIAVGRLPDDVLEEPHPPDLMTIEIRWKHVDSLTYSIESIRIPG